ncbi:MAG: FecCD family ABC transporter permease [Marinilabiliaceae bacterium]
MEKRFFIIAGLLGLLLASITFALVIGACNIDISKVYKVLMVHLIPGGDMDGINKLHNTLVWEIRLPRILLSVGVGTALALAGGVFQGCFRNPLVEPYILGASSGAAFGAALVIVFPTSFISLQTSAFVCASIAVFLAYLLARVRGETPIVNLILAGVIIGSIFSALVSILKYISDEAGLREIVFWLMGGFYYAVWADVFRIVPIVIVSFGMLWYFSWKLNILSMGDEEARTLGVNPEWHKFIFILVATLITAVSVSAVGIIAWVGLMMPHAARMILGADHRFMLPGAAIMGGIYMVLCDTLARTLVHTEIPVGIISSIIGAPYLIYLLRSKTKMVFNG